MNETVDTWKEKNLKQKKQNNTKKTYYNGWTGCSWVVHLVGCTGWMEAAHKTPRPEEDKLVGLVAVAGFAADIPAADHNLSAGTGSLAAAGHMLPAGSSYFDCN